MDECEACVKGKAMRDESEGIFTCLALAHTCSLEIDDVELTYTGF